MRLSILLVTLVFLQACLMPKVVAPMPVDTFSKVEDGRELVVMFPGYGDRAGTFREYDFFAEVAAQPGAFEDALFVATDAHIGYYRTRTLLERIEQDVLKAHGKRDQLTLLGVSMGGMGASIIASFHKEKVDRLILFAPYLGGKRFLKRIQSDGLADREDDNLRTRGLLKAWRYLLNDSKKTGVEITVLYGESDRLSEGIHMLAEKAPHVKVMSRAGGHGWKTWTPLWQTYLKEHAASMQP